MPGGIYRVFLTNLQGRLTGRDAVNGAQRPVIAGTIQAVFTAIAQRATPKFDSAQAIWIDCPNTAPITNKELMTYFLPAKLDSLFVTVTQNLVEDPNG